MNLNFNNVMNQNDPVHTGITQYQLDLDIPAKSFLAFNSSVLHCFN